MAPDGLRVTDGNPLHTRAWSQGTFLVQDEASQLVAEWADAQPSERVLDACAAPGGKATALAAALQGRGLLVAVDLRPRRITLLRQTIARMGTGNVAIVRADMARAAPFGAVFDLVVVDAPCSGLGTLRRDPDLRWRRREEELERLWAAELAMLRVAADAVRPGGRLLYATCSSEPEENESVVAAFLAERRGFEPLAPRLDPGRGFPIARLVTPAGHLRTSPPLHDLEAFFGALCRRVD